MNPDTLASVMEATWPPLRTLPVPGFTLRDGAGGGKRVSAATCHAGWTMADLTGAQAAMQGMGQNALFLIRAGDAGLDAALAERGYGIVDPVVAYAIGTDALGPPPWMTTFAHWPAMAIARDVWAAGGIGPARLSVMDRVQGAKTAILARNGDRMAGVAFVAVAGATAMLHALEVAPDRRRQGAARNMLHAAAGWAKAQGATTLSLVVTTANTGARALYEKCGMQPVGAYHYRQLQAQQLQAHQIQARHIQGRHIQGRG